MTTKRLQIEIETVMLLIIAGGIGVTLSLYFGRKPQLPTRIYLPALDIQNPTPSPTAPLIPKTQVTSQISPDGTKQLSMTVVTNKDMTKEYTFDTSEADGTNKQIIYASTSAQESMSIPFNTWSPDDKYVFIMHSFAGGSEALVMRADGQPIVGTEQNLNVTSIFTSKISGVAYQETTGWASDTLLILNTKASDGSKGPSYWFEVPDTAIIQLASQF